MPDAITGIAVIERTGGDIYSGIDALNPIGVSDVGAALNVLDNRVTGNVYMRGRALGKIDAAIDAYLDPAAPGGRLLAQDTRIPRRHRRQPAGPELARPADR